MIKLTVRRGELVQALTDLLERNEIRDGAIATLIGAVGRCTYTTMQPGDVTHDIQRVITNPAELSGCGEVVDGIPHLHVVLGAGGGQAFAGHLIRAHVAQPYFVNAYVIPEPAL